MRSTPATPSTTSPSSTTPLLSSLSRTSRSDVSPASSTASAGVVRRVSRTVVLLGDAMSRAPNEGVGRPRSGQMNGVALGRQPSGFPRHCRPKSSFARAGNEERRVEEQPAAARGSSRQRPLPDIPCDGGKRGDDARCALADESALSDGFGVVLLLGKQITPPRRGARRSSHGRGSALIEHQPETPLDLAADVFEQRFDSIPVGAGLRDGAFVVREDRKHFHRQDSVGGDEPFYDRVVRDGGTRHPVEVRQSTSERRFAEGVEWRVAHDQISFRVHFKEAWGAGSGRSGDLPDRRASAGRDDTIHVRPRVRHLTSSAMVASTDTFAPGDVMLRAAGPAPRTSRSRSNTSRSMRANSSGVSSPSSRRIWASSSCSRSALPSRSSSSATVRNLSSTNPRPSMRSESSRNIWFVCCPYAGSSFKRMLTKLYGGQGPVYLNVR